MLTALAPFLVAGLLLLILGTVYGAMRCPGDTRDRFVLRMVALLISASWLASGALALRAFR